MVVLLKNKTRQLRTYNVGDRSVQVARPEAVTTKRGQVGYRTVRKAVSSSVTLLPGQWTKVPGILLKQGAVKRDIAKGVLAMVQQETGEPAPEPKPVEVKSDEALKEPKGSHPPEEEGSVNIAEFKKAQKKAKGGTRA